MMIYPFIYELFLVKSQLNSNLLFIQVLVFHDLLVYMLPHPLAKVFHENVTLFFGSFTIGIFAK